MGGFVTNKAYKSTSELKELGVSAFLAFEEIFFVGIKFGDVENCIQGSFHELLRFR